MQLSPIFYWVLPEKDELTSIENIEKIIYPKKLNDLLEETITINYALMQYDVESQIGYEDDQSSVDITHKWVNARLNAATFLSELKNVDMVSVLDLAQLKSALKCTIQFSDSYENNSDDFIRHSKVVLDVATQQLKQKYDQQPFVIKGTKYPDNQYIKDTLNHYDLTAFTNHTTTVESLNSDASYIKELNNALKLLINELDKNPIVSNLG